MYPIITVNNLPLPSPTGIDIEVIKVDSNSQRSADATLIRNVVATKVKFTVEFGIQQKAEVQAFLAQVDLDEFPIQYYNVVNDEVLTGNFYHTDLKLSVKLKVNTSIMYKSWTLSFIEY